MKASVWKKRIGRRDFLKWAALTGFCFALPIASTRQAKAAAASMNHLFWVKGIPDQPFNVTGNGNYHGGVESLLHLMGMWGLKFYRSSQESDLGGPSGMIESNDVVLIKVNAQWKYRGCTNSDLVRGLIQRILDHPDGFSGEVVIFENGQGQGSLNGDALGWGSYPDQGIHANANDESHSFNYLVNTIFHDPRVSSYLLDPIRNTFIGALDHSANGYRRYENVSYPCFTTAGNHRVELREGIWQGNGYTQNLKLINIPVLKHHDTGGSEITASLKHFYGVVSMADGQSSFRHYGGLGETCGKMMVSVRTPVLNIIDAIWVSHISVSGYPASATTKANQILASQDPVALDYWAAKYILYPIDDNNRHHSGFSGINQWLTSARDTVNGRGGLFNPSSGILVSGVTKDEREMLVNTISLSSDDSEKILNLVIRFYHVILERDPEPGGAEWWTEEIEWIVSLGIDVKDAFQAIAKFFFNSLEYRLKGKGDDGFITDLYQALLNREPDPEGGSFWLGYLAQGLPRNMVITEIGFCEEFRLIIEDIFGPATSRPENNLVNDLYREFFNRFPDMQGFNYWLGMMRNAQCAGGQAVKDFALQMAKAFVNSLEYTLRNRDHSEFLEDLYSAILRRGADASGFNYWTGLLNQGAVTRDQVLQFFVDSPEFQLRLQEVIAAGCIQ